MTQQKQNGKLIAIITMIFLFGMISFVTNLAAPMGIVLKNQFSVSNALGMLGNFGNFIAYAVMGIPSGILLQRVGYKKTALIAVAVGFIGVGIQYLSGHSSPDMAFAVYLIGAFIAGFSMCLLNTVVAMNYILSGKKDKTNKTIQSEDKVLAQKNVDSQVENKDNKQDIETRLENILSNIKGVGNVKVLITYSQESTVIPMYDEDTSTSVTEEQDSGGGSRTVNESTSKKDIIYEENNGVKTPITQSIINPKIEGAIVTAKGANDANVKTNIIEAVEAVTGLATYKIQVFEMN